MPVGRVVRIPPSERTDFVWRFLELASRVASFHCHEHGEPAALGTVVGNRAGISGCCDALLDRVEKELER
jgi:hypothetical protein